MIPSIPRTFLLVLVQFLLAFCILWKGGKSLEATWLLALLAGGLTLAWWQGQLHLPKEKRACAVPQWLWWSGLAFLLWTIVAYIQSSTRNYGLDEVLRDASLWFVLLWIVRMRGTKHGEEMERGIIKVIAVCAVIACMVGVAVYSLQPVNRFVGTFFDHRFHTDYWPNAWGQFLLLAWPAVILATSSMKKAPWTSVTRTAALGLLFGCLLLSYSRGAMMAFAGQIVLLSLFSVFVWWKAKKRMPIKEIGIATIGAMIIGAAIFFGANQLRSRLFDVQSVTEKVTFTADEGRSSIDERSQFWHQSYALMLERPLLGWGPYSFRFVQPRLQGHVLATSDHPHNVFLKLGMERGVIAMLLFGVIVIGILFFAVRKLWDSTRILLVIAVAGVLAHNLIDYNLQFVGIALPFWLLLGCIATPCTKSPANMTLHLRRIVEVLLASALLIVTIAEGRMLVLSSFGRHAEAAGKADEALAWYDQADGEWFSRDMYLGKANLLYPASYQAEAVEMLERYLAENAEDARAWKLYGDFLEQRDPKRMDAYARAYAYGRYDYVGMINAYLVFLRDEKGGEKLDSLEPELDKLFQNYAEAIKFNVHFIALSQNVEEFQELANTLAQLYPVKAAAYRKASDEAWAKAQQERTRFAERQPGMLW